MIVARAFPGPTSGRGGRLAVDPTASFHGTHVAGIAAGDAGTCSPGGSDHPPTCGLSGVAPRAYLGNYRVFTVPTPAGMVADTPPQLSFSRTLRTRVVGSSNSSRISRREPGLIVVIVPSK